ncbi:hypothetical protein HDU81_001708 [Chytriomyces hyalinus]|nr:hypothetical protein HDU81_001708 [Chytriomyces hyalinus]
MYGLELKTIEYDALFHRKGGRMLPAVQLAKRYHGFELSSRNAALLAVFAGVAGELEVLRESLGLCGADVVSNVFTWAAATGKMDTIEYLIGVGVTPPASSLVHAASNAHLNVCRRLLGRDVPRFYASTLGVALIAACEANHVQTVAFLLSLDEIDPAHNKNAALIGSVNGGHTAIVELLIGTGKSDASDQENKAILVATSKGFEEIVELLMRERVAASKGFTAIVKLLLGWKGANGESVDPTAQENAALIQAAKHGHLDVVELLLDIPSVNPKSRKNLALYEACCHGHTLVAQLLYTRNPQLDMPVAIRACEQAALSGHTQTVQFLLERVHVPISASFLLTASDAGHVETVSLLFERGELEFHPQTLTCALALAAAKNHV